MSAAHAPAAERRSKPAGRPRRLASQTTARFLYETDRIQYSMAYQLRSAGVTYVCMACHREEVVDSTGNWWSESIETRGWIGAEGAIRPSAVVSAAKMSALQEDEVGPIPVGA